MVCFSFVIGEILPSQGFLIGPQKSDPDSGGHTPFSEKRSQENLHDGRWKKRIDSDGVGGVEGWESELQPANRGGENGDCASSACQNT
jgi:hypothetical protein